MHNDKPSPRNLNWMFLWAMHELSAFGQFLVFWKFIYIIFSLFAIEQIFKEGEQTGWKETCKKITGA